MKKLMFAAALAAVGSAFAVESANIVGYDQFEDSLAGWAGTMVTPEFITAGASEASTFQAKDLVPTLPAESEDDLAENIQIQILNDDGTCDDENDLTWDGEKWVYTSGRADAMGKAIDAGTGLWILTGVETSYFQSSGEVGKKAVTIPLGEYAGAAAGNPFPVQGKFSDITPVLDPEWADAGEELAENVEIQILNDDGTCNDENDVTWDGEKWVYTTGRDDASDKILKKGAGLWTLTSCGGASLYIPVPTAIQSL